MNLEPRGEDAVEDPNAPQGVRTTSAATEELARELYWAASPIPDHGTAQLAGDPADLVRRWSELEATLRRDSSVHLPQDEPFFRGGGSLKRWIKRTMFRALRPLTRRYDRIDADIGALGIQTAQQIVAAREATEELEFLRGAVGELTSELRVVQADLEAARLASRQQDRRLGTTASALEVLEHRLGRSAEPSGEPAPSAGASVVTSVPFALPDEFYWRFETAMRGSPQEIEEKLARYEDFAVGLREEIGGSPLWLDLGCGEGGFALLLRSWGWRVLGMDISPQAVESCIEQGIDATEGALPEFLLTYEGEPPGGMSAIQVIEHLPVDAWLPTIRFALAALAPDGALVIETINPLNPIALGSAFFADVTHTWPANPWTIREMARFAGFDDIEVRFMNPDGNDAPQDYALIARKRA